jgi:iron complex outermembrane receptor protein
MLIDGERGIPVGLGAVTPYYRRFTTWRAAGISVSHAGAYAGGRLRIDEQLYLRLYDNLLDAYDDRTYSSQERTSSFHTWYHDRIFGGRVRAHHHIQRTPWGPTTLRLWLGAQHDRHREQSASEADTLLTRSLLTVAPEAEAFIGETLSLLAGLQLNLEVPGTTASESLGSRTAIGPLLSTRFDPLPGLMTRATVARRTRFPSLRDRFSRGTGSRIPNPHLRPESAWHVALEGTWRATRWLKMETSVYSAEVEDLITFVTLVEGEDRGKEQLQNIEGARITGADVGVELQPWSWLRLDAAYSFVRARRTDGEDPRLEYRPTHRATTMLTVAPLRWLELSTVARVTGAQGYRNPASEAWEELPPRVRWDGRLAVRPLPDLTFWLRADNLLDADHQSTYGFPEPGRRVWVGLRATFGGVPAGEP